MGIVTCKKDMTEGMEATSSDIQFLMSQYMVPEFGILRL